MVAPHFVIAFTVRILHAKHQIIARSSHLSLELEKELLSLKLRYSNLR